MRQGESGGTLQVGNGGTSGTLPAGTVSVGSGAALVFDRSDKLAVPSVISGLGTITPVSSCYERCSGDSFADGWAGLLRAECQHLAGADELWKRGRQRRLYTEHDARHRDGSG
jgi:hypothetical protein